ncbi:MAG: glycosyltransferase family 2 protein [Polyangiaceae bacterium]
MTGSSLGIALFLWSYGVGATSLYGIARAALLRRASPPALTSKPRVLLLRPCAGAEPELDRALLSLRHAVTTAAISCRFAVESPEDPAAPAAERAAAELRAAGLDASTVFTHAEGPNHKAAQIDAVLAAETAPTDALLIADSDVDLTGFDLDALLSPLFESSVAAVWCPPVETGTSSTAGDMASAAVLTSSLHAFTLLSALDGGSLVGKLFAVRRDAVDSAGGFRSMKRVLGEDMELARLLASQGHVVKVCPRVARSLKSGRTWSAAADRYARWLTVIRAQRPHLLASYPLLFFATPLLLTAALALAPFAPVHALATAAVTLSTRLITAFAGRMLAGLPFSLRASIVGAALSDALLAHAFARALATRTITWRGRTLKIDRRGTLREAV